jgi:hypothetical protein
MRRVAFFGKPVLLECPWVHVAQHRVKPPLPFSLRIQSIGDSLN